MLAIPNGLLDKYGWVDCGNEFNSISNSFCVTFAKLDTLGDLCF